MTQISRHARRAQGCTGGIVELRGKGTDDGHREKALLPGERRRLIDAGLFELGDDGATMILTAKGRAHLRRLERGESSAT